MAEAGELPRVQGQHGPLRNAVFIYVRKEAIASVAEAELINAPALETLAGREPDILRHPALTCRTSEKSLNSLKDLVLISTFPLLCVFEPSVKKERKERKKNCTNHGKIHRSALHFFPN